jgi:hypothetical protein
VRNSIRGLLANVPVLGDIFVALWRNRRWWLIPLVLVLVLFGLLLAFAAVSGVGPFIYALF